VAEEDEEAEEEEAKATGPPPSATRVLQATSLPPASGPLVLPKVSV
jgi:hypothetical protein